jgi:tryptophan-rich sensory protein
MPVSQLVFFVCWLAVALLGAAALVFVWQKWQAKSDPGKEPGKRSREIGRRRTIS